MILEDMVRSAGFPLTAALHLHVSPLFTPCPHHFSRRVRPSLWTSSLHASPAWSPKLTRLILPSLQFQEFPLPLHWVVAKIRQAHLCGSNLKMLTCCMNIIFAIVSGTNNSTWHMVDTLQIWTNKQMEIHSTLHINIRLIFLKFSPINKQT